MTTDKSVAGRTRQDSVQLPKKSTSNADLGANFGRRFSSKIRGPFTGSVSAGHSPDSSFDESAQDPRIGPPAANAEPRNTCAVKPKRHSVEVIRAPSSGAPAGDFLDETKSSNQTTRSEIKIN